ncbi:hypothetical protein [Paenibacillus lautus]|uniref:hypothetical protein n=1 Tax=Paenibacillus lautus TaxID=1401 RepID=UPI003D2C5893
MTKLDVGGAVWSREMIDELIQTISNEFPELKPTQLPIGIIAKCHLGDPFETHILDRALEIVEHYKFGQVLPSGMEKGRALALHPSYDYIEVYSDSLCAVSKNGNVSIIKG